MKKILILITMFVSLYSTETDNVIKDKEEFKKCILKNIDKEYIIKDMNEVSMKIYKDKDEKEKAVYLETKKLSYLSFKRIVENNCNEKFNKQLQSTYDFMNSIPNSSELTKDQIVLLNIGYIQSNVIPSIMFDNK